MSRAGSREPGTGNRGALDRSPLSTKSALGAGAIESDVAAYYSAKLREHGATARGVDWNGEASQELRFAQLLRIVEPPCGAVHARDSSSASAERATLLDFGCGYGALLDTLRRRGLALRYVGYDISETMIDAARRRFADATDCTFSTSLADLAPADYAVASGVFNVRLSHDAAAWQAYVERTIARLASLSRRGFAFNVLTSYADEDRKRVDLYYADPCFWFDHCKRRYSRQVALLHDYPLYEFTLLVRAVEEGQWQSS